MNITSRLQLATAPAAPMQQATLRVNAAVAPLTATPVIAASAALVAAFGVGFAVGQATCRG
jgi:hypothetical protein